MHFLTDILVLILSTYLAFANALAGFIESAVLSEGTETSMEETTESEPSEKLSELSKTYAKGGDIPQILIENAAYQKAAIVESIDPKTATATALEALVNIYCTYRTGDEVRITTGTGFFIDTDGVILTNAHVAQYLLLADIIGETECVIRSGNPAQPKYIADLLYISPAWIRENANLLSEAKPKGTGERDYALLYIKAGYDNAPIPGFLPALPFDTDLLNRNTLNSEVFAAGYPADSLRSEGTDFQLVPKLATTSIAEMMTFGTNYADIFSIRGTVIGERGSSGGPVVDEQGNVIGMISTKGDEAQFGAGTLRAITLSYIDRTIKEETGYGLRENASGNIPYRAEIFKETLVPFLKLLLEQEL